MPRARGRAIDVETAQVSTTTEERSDGDADTVGDNMPGSLPRLLWSPPVDRDRPIVDEVEHGISPPEAVRSGAAWRVCARCETVQDGLPFRVPET